MATKQTFNKDFTYVAITVAPKTRITQHGTWAANDTQLSIVNGDATVEGTDPEANLKQQGELYANKGKKSFAKLKWNGDNQVLIFNSMGDPPLVLARQVATPGTPAGSSPQLPAPK